ncbi:MAG: restriction endonuclease subunit S [Segatella copri]|nr:restriction endonuclease subunit S [Segatella copri]
MGGVSMVLSDLVDVIGGGTPKTTEESYWNGSIPWLSVKDFCGDKKYVYNTEKSITVEGLNNSSTKLLHKDNIIISARGTVGELAMIPYDMAFNQSCFGLIPKGNNDPHFVYYLLKDKVRSLKSQTQGSVFDTITKATFDRIECADYSEEDQRRIASILSSLDRKIELNNKINADLEEMAQAIFKNWFVDFEPFKDGKFVDSELGMIPEGWKIGSLGDFCNVFTGKKNTNQAIEKGLYPFFSCAPEPLASNDAIFNGKAIIIAGNGSYTGRTSFYNGGFDLYQRTYACTIREQDKENLMIFFYHMMKQFFEPTKMGGTRGSSIPYIVMGDITQQKFPYSKDWLIRFSNIANSMMDRKLRIDKENSRLSLLRDTLLPRLMSGELEVPE